MHHWLMKSEPGTFSIDDLARVSSEPWTGVRNYQARNFMWKEMRPGDPVLFYHSNAKPPGIAGLAVVCSEAYPDPTQFDPASEYFDAKAASTSPRWWLVDVKITEKWPELLPLEALKADPVLAEMVVCQRGSRLSITPVEAVHYARVLEIQSCSLCLVAGAH